MRAHARTQAVRAVQSGVDILQARAVALTTCSQDDLEAKVHELQAQLDAKGTCEQSTNLKSSSAPGEVGKQSAGYLLVALAHSCLSCVEGLRAWHGTHVFGADCN